MQRKIGYALVGVAAVVAIAAVVGSAAKHPWVEPTSVVSANEPLAAGSMTIPPLVLAEAGQPYPEGIEYEVLPTLVAEGADTPGEVRLHRFVARRLTYDEIVALGDALSMRTTPKQDAVGHYVFTQGDRIMTIDPLVGTWDCIDQAKMWAVAPEKQSSIPSDEDARRIAEEAIRRLGLNREDLVFAAVKPATLSPLGVEDGALGEGAQIVSKQVYFRKVVDNLPVEGSARVVVGVGADGEIVGVINNMKLQIPDQTVAIKGFETVLEEARRGGGQTSIPSNTVKAVLSGIKLAYYEGGGGLESQPFLQPVYVLEGVAEIADGGQQAFSITLPAVAQ